MTVVTRLHLTSAFAGVLLSAVLFVLAAVVVYNIFYTLVPFDRYSGEGTAAFKAGFWIAYSAHLLIVPIVVTLVARYLRWHALPAALSAVLVVSLLAFPTLTVVAYFNNCQGMEYPLGHMNCG